MAQKQVCGMTMSLDSELRKASIGFLMSFSGLMTIFKASLPPT